MSAYRKLTETLRHTVAVEAYHAWQRRNEAPTVYSDASSEPDSWSHALALLEDELRAMGDDE